MDPTKYTLAVFVQNGCQPCNVVKRIWGKFFSTIRSEFSEEILDIIMVRMEDGNKLSKYTSLWPSVYIMRTTVWDEVNEGRINLKAIEVFGSSSIMNRTPHLTKALTPSNVKNWIEEVFDKPVKKAVVSGRPRYVTLK